MRVLLIGAGRYGNDIIGRKYASGKYGVKLVGVVDPKIEQIREKVNFSLHGVPAYKTIDDVPQKLVRNCYSDVALIPQVVPEVYGKLVDKGARKIILPKPVVMTKKEFTEIENITKQNNVLALIASNWHYSKISAILKSLINKITNGGSVNFEGQEGFEILFKKIASGYKIDKVEIEYSKKDEVLTIDPPMQELPHALQIVYSTGMSDLDKIKAVLEKNLQSKSRVNVSLQNSSNITQDISINSDLHKTDLGDKRRERLVKIYLSKNDEHAVIIADYDALFNEKGKCEKYPSISYEISDKNQAKGQTLAVIEDNMDTMYETIIKRFKGEDNNALTLDKYKPIAETLFDVHKQWKKEI